MRLGSVFYLIDVLPHQRRYYSRLIIHKKRRQTNLFISFCGAGGIEVEPNHSLSPENENFLLLIKDLLDAVEAMEKSEKET